MVAYIKYCPKLSCLTVKFYIYDDYEDRYTGCCFKGYSFIC